MNLLFNIHVLNIKETETYSALFKKKPELFSNVPTLFGVIEIYHGTIYPSYHATERYTITNYDLV